MYVASLVGTRRLELALTLPPGVTVLFGPSGAGKSTCLSALAGLVRPKRGRIVLAGRTLFDAATGVDVPPHARRVALVFQTLSLFPHLTVLENVAFGVPRSVVSSERRGLATRWLERMHVAPLSTRQPSTLSGGEAQRVALARALASSPRLLLLDEPFSALDRSLRSELAQEVASVVRELGIPALLVTHDRDDAAQLGERLVCLRDGRLDESPGARSMQRGI
ncbi:MAG: Molybdenum transport ATP-binding protein ModC [Myxococcaceae bacterium]|nr:Molybdenum transport ATP-binding protein ModC [Myxococcaceae bacterium]